MTDAPSRAAALRSQLEAKARQHEATGTIDIEVMRTLRESGLLSLVKPACRGGAEGSFTDVFEVVAALAEGCMSTAWVATVGNVHHFVAAAFPAAAQDEYFAAGDVFSAASFAPTGTARMTPDGFIADGTWGFLSGVDHAQWVFLAALVPESCDARSPGVWFLQVPKAEVTVEEDSWVVTGLAGTGSKSVKLAQVFVAQHRAVFLPQLMEGAAPGFALHEGALYRAPFRPALIAVLAAPILGAARAAAAQFRAYTSQRTVKMTGGRQAEQTATQITLAEVTARIDSAELLLRDVFRRIDATPRRPAALFDATCNRDTAFAVRQLNAAVNQIIANAGGGAAQLSNPLQRIWRDVQVASNHAALDWSTNARAWGAAALLPDG